MARMLSIKDAINEALDQEMSRDPTVIMMGEDIIGEQEQMVKKMLGEVFLEYQRVCFISILSK